jgi:hypothetical protein
MIQDRAGSTPVHFLARNGVKEILKLPKELLKIKDDDGCTPIHFLANSGVKIPEELKYLI